MFANIIVDISCEKLDRTFQYSIPEGMSLQPGMVVCVPFGKGERKITGYVVEITEYAEIAVEKIKPICFIKEDSISVESHLIALAAWMREQYGSTMVQALKTVLPVKEKVAAKTKRYLVLAVSEEKAEEYLETINKNKYKARVRVLNALIEQKILNYKEASEQYGLNKNMADFFVKEEIAVIQNEKVYRNPIKEIRQIGQPVFLMDMQKQAVEGILREWKSENPRPCLLHGVTGSGKTQVYIELMEHVLREGKQVIVLIPEIALTFQTVQRFYQRFGQRVSVINSKMSQGERFDQFCRAKNGEVQIMIGPRSALFTPFPNLGLILIDEEHEQSYKSEISPRYHAREAAVKRAQLENARVLLGSATPSMESYYRAQNQEYALFTMNVRYEERPLPKVEIIDLKEELKAGNRSILSRHLAEAIDKRLKASEQMILFLNRRGYAGFIACRSCGYVAKCPHCDVALTEHRGGKMVCHYCGYETRQIHSCPSCGSPYIGGFKAGTQQVEEVIRKKFPDARILRMDYDTTRKKGDYESILDTFSRKEADILLGTQMIVKGHDFPGVTLVGVLAADISLYAEDFRSSERTFQLLCQAVGRAGRGLKEGEAIIQTYHPEHSAIQKAAEQNYLDFYENEISYRKMMRYPPVASIISILAQGEDETYLETAMEYLKKFIIKIYPHRDLQLIGPADQSLGKANDLYRKVIYIRHKEERILLAIKEKLERYILANAGFQKIYIQFDYEGR